MPHAKLSMTFVKHVVPGAGDAIYWDETLPGFGLRVKPSGVKSYVVQYRARPSGASRRKTLGQVGPLMSLHQAREIARGVLADALRGGDPVSDDKRRRAAPTVSDLAAECSGMRRAFRR